jgi:hypothetical protein
MFMSLHRADAGLASIVSPNSKNLGRESIDNPEPFHQMARKSNPAQSNLLLRVSSLGPSPNLVVQTPIPTLTAPITLPSLEYFSYLVSNHPRRASRSVCSSPVMNWSYILRSGFDVGEGICIQAEAAPQARRLRDEEDVGEGGA